MGTAQCAPPKVSKGGCRFENRYRPLETPDGLSRPMARAWKTIRPAWIGVDLCSNYYFSICRANTGIFKEQPTDDSARTNYRHFSLISGRMNRSPSWSILSQNTLLNHPFFAKAFFLFLFQAIDFQRFKIFFIFFIIYFKKRWVLRNHPLH